MRVLILADDCNPYWPSLPVVGYKAARAIADCVEVVVATHIRNRENIEKVGFGRARVRYIDNEHIARPIYKFAKWMRGGTATAWTTAMAFAYPSYIAFEREVWKATCDELRGGEFDLVHRLTPMSPTLPSPMAGWSPVPFILGPINGGLKWPPSFRRELAREGEWLSFVRDVYRALPYYKSTYRNSAVALAAFKHTCSDLPIGTQTKVINFPEVGIDRGLFDQMPDRTSRKRKTILFAGRFVPYKLPQLLVRVFADRPALHNHRLLMVGDGPERPAIERLVASRGLEKQVELAGWKTQAELASIMREADIFAFPSIRELGAGVLLEAMASGLACVAVDYGGPATLIDASRGVKVPMSNIDQLTENFGNALELLVSNEQMSADFGSAARQYAMHYYTWEAKALKTISVYEWVLGRGQRPDFWD